MCDICTENPEKTYVHPGEAGYPSYGNKKTLEVDGGDFRIADGWFKGYYFVPRRDPATGEALLDRPGFGLQRATTYTNLTTFKGGALELHDDAYLMYGMVLRPDLYGRLAKLGGPPDKRAMTEEEKKARAKAYEQIRKEAWQAANKDLAANNGSAIHEGVEHVNKGGSLDDLPEIAKPWTPQIVAYSKAIAAAGVVIDPAEVECTVISNEAEAAGKFDFIGSIELTEEMCRAAGFPLCDDNGVPYADEPGKPKKRIFDAKSGDVGTDFGKRDSIGRQLLFYATADAIFDRDAVEYRPLPEGLDTRVGFIVEIPWWLPEGEKVVARIIPVLFEKNGGKPGLQACSEVKGLKRGQARELYPIAEAYAEETPVEEPKPEPKKRATRKKAAATPTFADEQQVVAEAEAITVTAATYLDRILAADDKDEVIAIGKEAQAAGVPDEEWKPAAKKHLAGLMKKA